MANVIAKLAAVLSLNHSQFSSGLKSAGQQTQTFQSKVSRTATSTGRLSDVLKKSSLSANALGYSMVKRFIGPTAAIGMLVGGFRSLNAEMERGIENGVGFTKVDWGKIVGDAIPTFRFGGNFTEALLQSGDTNASWQEWLKGGLDAIDSRLANLMFPDAPRVDGLAASRAPGLQLKSSVMTPRERFEESVNLYDKIRRAFDKPSGKNEFQQTYERLVLKVFELSGLKGGGMSSGLSGGQIPTNQFVVGGMAAGSSPARPTQTYDPKAVEVLNKILEKLDVSGVTGRAG